MAKLLTSIYGAYLIKFYKQVCQVYFPVKNYQISNA